MKNILLSGVVYCHRKKLLSAYVALIMLNLALFLYPCFVLDKFPPDVANLFAAWVFLIKGSHGYGGTLVLLLAGIVFQSISIRYNSDFQVGKQIDQYVLMVILAVLAVIMLYIYHLNRLF